MGLHVRPVVRLIGSGAIAGLAGTVAMTVPILLARRFGLLATPPPVEITARAGRRSRLVPDPTRPAFPLVWPIAHLAYGAGSGVVFALVRRAMPERTIPAGLAFGATVWGVSYLGVVPALRLYPWPTDDRRSGNSSCSRLTGSSAWSSRAGMT